MKTSTSLPKLTSPKLTAEEVKGLQEYWQVYEAHRDDIAGNLLAIMDELPEFPRSVLESLR